MNRLLSIIATVLIVLWIIGYYRFDMNGLFHVLLVGGLIVLILRLVRYGRGGY